MIREELLALADELEGMDCRTCPADGTKDCRDLPCEEAVARAAARRIREVVEHDACEGTTVSAYDLLSDENRKAIAWVREHGGLGAVEKRLMPEGMEWLLDVWPKWSNGEYCKFGDWWTADKYGNYEPKQLRRLVFYTPEQLREWWQDEGENFGYEWDFMRTSDTTYRPDKVEQPEPKVLDADGVEIRVGDTVWDVESGIEYEVVGIHTDEDTPVRVMRTDCSHLTKAAKPSTLTHRAPAIAADGKPLRVWETVYKVNGDGTAYVFDGMSDYIDGLAMLHYDGKPYVGTEIRVDQLTHQRPVLDADGNRIEPAMDVWWVRESDERGIHAGKLHVESIGEDGFVTCSPFNGGTWVELDSTDLYVHEPVLDADGEPIKEGDTVYLLPGEWCERFSCLWVYGVEELNVLDLNPKYGGIGSIKCCKAGKMTSLCYPKSSQLTHTNPESPDTYAKLYEDVHDERCGSEEFVRRCRALAERGEL